MVSAARLRVLVLGAGAQAWALSRCFRLGLSDQEETNFAANERKCVGD
jgi:hypothetical protein